MAAKAAYLKFPDADALKKTIAEVSKATDKQAALQQIATSYTSEGISDSFHSLAANPDRNLPVLTQKGKAAHKTLAKSIRAGAATNALSMEVLAPDEVLADQMVPDPNLAAVLNDQLEVQVGSQIYKITPQGTFFAEAANKTALDAMVSDQAQDPDDVEPGTLVSTDIYDMGNGVSRFDTFGSAETIELQSVANATSGGTGSSTNSFSSPCGIAQPASSTYTASLTAQQYCSFPAYGYGAHTIVGKFLQGIFGANSDRTENFDSNHRIKLKLYSFNYLVYSSIGLKAKFQKKGFLGIWGTMKAPKLVLGWDAVIFESPLVYSQPNPQPVPSFPSSKVGKAVAAESFKFINFEVPAGMISEFSSSLLGNYGFTSPSAIENDLKQLDQTLLEKVSKDLWTYVTQTYSPGELAFQKSVTAGFRMIFPDKVTVALSRWEKTATDTEEVDLVFDWNTCRLTYAGTIGGDFNFANNVLKPTYSNKAFSYNVKKASVYGAAQYGGAWKGIRIIQE